MGNKTGLRWIGLQILNVSKTLLVKKADSSTGSKWQFVWFLKYRFIKTAFLESLTKQQICVDIPTMAELKSAESNPEEEKANKVKQHITLKTMRSIMDGTYQEWIEELTKNEYPQPKM